jgi:hypothetical protein
MNRLRVCSNGICGGNQLYNGKICAEYIIIDSLPHMLSDRFHNEYGSHIKYRYCDFQNVNIPENPRIVDGRKQYSFRECIITLNVFRFLKESHCQDFMHIYFYDCKFMEIADTTYLTFDTVDTVGFSGHGEPLNASILNIAKNVRYTTTFKNFHISRDILKVNFFSSKINFRFENCTFEEGLIGKIATRRYDANFVFTGSSNSKQLRPDFIRTERFTIGGPLSISYENMEIDDDTFAPFQGLCVSIKIIDCTFNFSKNASMSHCGVHFYRIKIEKCEICDKTLKAFPCTDDIIEFISCSFHLSNGSKSLDVMEHKAFNIIMCDGVESLVNSLETYGGEFSIYKCILDTEKIRENVFLKCRRVSLYDITFKGSKPFPMLRYSNGEMDISSRKVYNDPEDLPNQCGEVNCKSLRFRSLTLSNSFIQSLHGKVEVLSISSSQFGVSLKLPEKLQISDGLCFYGNIHCKEICIGNPQEIRKIHIQNCLNLEKIMTPRGGVCPVVGGMVQFKKNGEFRNIEPDGIEIRGCRNFANGGKVVE